MSRADGGLYVYRDGELYCDDVPLADIAASYGTPTYVYAGRAIDAAYADLREAVQWGETLIAYAVKANTNHALLKRLAGHGCGADIVSGGELIRALRAGIAPEKIVFSGVGKRDDEIVAALEAGIRAIHVESAAELHVVRDLAQQRGVVAPVTLRVNPHVDPQTHPYIATGLKESKFGVSVEVGLQLAAWAKDQASLQLEGVACHVGSQIRTPNALEEAVSVLAGFVKQCQAMGAPLRSLDAGGGFPLTYGDESEAYPSWSVYGEAIHRGLESLRSDEVDLIVEPGRVLVGGAGSLLARVLYTKEQEGRRFVIVDAAMTELIRPALYQAHHDIVPLIEPDPDAAMTPADVVGPVCESGDFLALQRPLPPLSRGDLLVVQSAGAYGMSMASRYNSRPLAAEVLIDGDQSEPITGRECPQALWG